MVGGLQTIGSQEMAVLSPILRIFIVDDEDSSLAALGYRLMKENPYHNFKVHFFASGEECIRNLHLGPKLIIMDQYLLCNSEGSLCGAGLIRKIRKAEPDLPIVVISGKRKPAFIMEADEQDSYYYLVKDHAAFVSVKKILGMIGRPIAVH